MPMRIEAMAGALAASRMGKVARLAHHPRHVAEEIDAEAAGGAEQDELGRCRLRARACSEKLAAMNTIAANSAGRA